MDCRLNSTCSAYINQTLNHGNPLPSFSIIILQFSVYVLGFSNPILALILDELLCVAVLGLETLLLEFVIVFDVIYKTL